MVQETYLFILAVALAGFGLGLPKDPFVRFALRQHLFVWPCGPLQETGGAPLVPMGFAPGSLFQPELLVIVQLGGCRPRLGAELPVNSSEAGLLLQSSQLDRASREQLGCCSRWSLGCLAAGSLGS